MAELKKCPFCGGKPRKEATQHSGLNIFFVVCDGCGAAGPIFSVPNPRVKDDDNPAIKAWNHRIEEVK